jgi:hypothetical protein
MMNVTENVMQAQANQVVVSDVAAGLNDAKNWLIATTKLAGLQSKAVNERPGVLVSNMTTIDAGGNQKRIDKFKAMVRRAVNGFRDSKDWSITRDEYDGWVFVSSDGKWQVTISDRYNGSGGWKVATLTMGITIKARVV